MSTATYSAEYRRGHPEQARASALAEKAKRRALIYEAKARPCMDCGQTFPPYVMDLDHRDGSEKEFSLGYALSSRGLAAIREELLKCDPVCSNCHRIRTFKRRQSYTRGVMEAVIRPRKQSLTEGTHETSN